MYKNEFKLQEKSFFFRKQNDAWGDKLFYTKKKGKSFKLKFFFVSYKEKISKCSLS